MNAVALTRPRALAMLAGHGEDIVENLTAGDLTIEVSTEDDVVRCVWKGKSSDRQPGTFLAPYFETLLGEASSAGAALEMHFEDLEHFNSSTITALIRLIQSSRAWCRATPRGACSRSDSSRHCGAARRP
jgi:hypothetical protein